MKNPLVYALGLAWNLGYIIALPIVILGFSGAWLDKTLSTSPLFILLGIFLSLIFSSIGIYRKVKTLSN